MRPHGRHRTVNWRHPVAKAICDCCGFPYNLVDLSWQMEWAGRSLVNKRLLVCPTCLDEPNEQLRTIILPADPRPVRNARPENFTNIRDDYLIAEATPDNLTDESGNLLIRD